MSIMNWDECNTSIWYVNVCITRMLGTNVMVLPKYGEIIMHTKVFKKILSRDLFQDSRLIQSFNLDARWFTKLANI